MIFRFRSAQPHSLIVPVFSSLLASSPLVAQEATYEESDIMLEEVIVTATKRMENIQDTPVTMDVISSDDIENAGFGSSDAVAAGLAEHRAWSI